MEPTEINRLLQALKHPDPAVREEATAEFWYRWFHQKGAQGARLLLQSQSLIESGDLQAAADILNDVIAAQPDFAEARNRRAVFYYMQGNYWGAIADCQQVLSLIPYHFGALHGLGLCQAAVGNHRTAIQTFHRALEIQPFAVINQRLILECTAQLS
jgi:tetratricopeptide (TPR) repeat protein